ncbi:delta-like protein 4, partial [Biomphalaria pfeifferi]
RNVGLKQDTWQTSNYEDLWNSTAAVDGSTDSNIDRNSCTHTCKGDHKPTWGVRFNATEITRYVLYNRK